MSMEQFNFLLAEFEPPPPESGNEVGNISGSLKAEDEIQRFTIDEDIGDIERYRKYLTGHIFQQRVAIECLPGLVHEHGKSAFSAVASTLKKTLSSIDTEGQVAIAAAIGVMCELRRLRPAEQAELVAPIVLKQLSVREPVPEVLEAWLGCLAVLAPNLDRVTLGGGLADLVAAKSEPVGPGVTARVTACRILGAIAPGLGRAQVEDRFFRRAMDLCQDTDYQVRVAMARQLAEVASVMGQEATENTILTEVFELLRDEEVQVRTAAMACLVDVLDVVSPEALKSTVGPKFVEFCGSLSSDPRLVPGLSANIGPMLAKLAPHFGSPSDLEACVQAFCTLGARDEEEVRKKCAASFLTILKVVGGKRYSTFLHDIFVLLASDRDEEVRQSIASQFHQVCPLLGRARCMQFLKYPLIKLLKDPCREVKEHLCTELGATLRAFAGTDAEQLAGRAEGDEFLAEVAPALLELYSSAGTNWRLKMSLIRAMAGFPMYFASEQVFDVFLPIVTAALQGGVAGVKSAATRTVVMFLRYVRRPAQKLEIYTTLLREFARSRSSCHRLTFLQVCVEVMATASNRFFRLYFLDPAVETVYDRVPNVRLQLTTLLPRFKELICLPQDVDKLERLTTAMSSLTNDDDRDVSETARRLNEDFKRIQVSMGGKAGSSGRDAAEDKRREEEEVALGFPKDDFERVKNEDPSWVDKKGQTKEKRPPFATGGRTTGGAGGGITRRTAAVPRAQSTGGVEASGGAVSASANARRTVELGRAPLGSRRVTPTRAAAPSAAMLDGPQRSAGSGSSVGTSRIARLQGSDASLVRGTSLQRRVIGGDSSSSSSRGPLASTAGRLAKAQLNDGGSRTPATSPGSLRSPTAAKPPAPTVGKSSSGSSRAAVPPTSTASKIGPPSRRSTGGR
uniref:Serine/threonine-protein phosphatase 4 regulatory subunit 4 n=1 Tax=Tetraselmis chuii TaxID=63592 RepID=A0A6U1I351_9CHLO|mmetsp:Transcript_30421/g.54487  ORF Transcript_30421/g.54487 Transcript_30421/m.54487 type:complete len:907 (+) Transcript_30421:713-3433(+)